MNGYDLSRDWFDWCFENPDIITPNHSALYFFIIEHCNRMGWKEKFGLPMEMAKSAIGIKNYKTYSKTFENLVEWGFVKVYQRSKNQYSANVIGLVENTKANTKALTKATLKHSQKQVHGIVGIDKPINLEQYSDFPEKVIEMFRVITGKKIKLNAERKTTIIARAKEKNTLEDFEKVIRVKFDEWKDDPKFSKFITPETLFRVSNFTKYLEQEQPVLDSYKSTIPVELRGSNEISQFLKK